MVPGADKGISAVRCSKHLILTFTLGVRVPGARGALDRKNRSYFYFFVFC